MAGDRYYYDEEGNRQSYYRDMLQMQREQRKMESRDARLQRKEDRKNLFNDKKLIAKSFTEQKKSKADAEKPVNVIKNKDGLRALIEAINARLDAASIDAECNASGAVVVTLNI